MERPTSAAAPDDAGELEAKTWLAGVFDRAAPTYDDVGGGYHDYFGARLVMLADVAEGDSVLDVACGRGATLLPAAIRAGTTGQVLGIDLSPEMVRLAQRRLEAAGVEGEVRVMDAENLDGVPDASHSVVLCGFGLFFLPHPERAVAEFRRVLVPGGRIALSTWGAEDPRWAWEDDLFGSVSVQRKAVRRPFNQAADLVELLETAGFDDVSVTAEQHEVRLADADEWWAWKWSYSLRGILEQLSAAELARLRDEAGRRIAGMAAEGLPLRLEALCAVARRGPQAN